MGRLFFALHAVIYPFQSTHPVWDGTKGGVTITRDGYISIHPSRVGWDITRSCGT